jgi:hypothetical protein
VKKVAVLRAEIRFLISRIQSDIHAKTLESVAPYQLGTEMEPLIRNKILSS